MTNTFRDCPGCRCPREFVSIHPDPEGCPDVSSGICPEWFCTACGTGLLIEVPHVLASTEPLDRVA